ncbi:hypothetical protein ACIRBY_37070 [Streptomyces sp. NPDC096136]|uniref:hypothetical protein n=1 Tax=Streptomyces sp. NPDC096136 TaxID=3366076 RepID=UPI00382AB4FA
MSELLTWASAAHPFAVLADVPAPSSVAPPGVVQSKFTLILGWVMWVVSGLAVIGIFVVAGKMFTSFRTGEGSEHMNMLGKVLAGCILAASAAPIVNAIL